MMDQGKVELFGNLLKEAFPGDMVNGAEDFDRDCWFYRITAGPSTRMSHRVRVLRDFFDDNDETAIRKTFHDWRLAEIIRQAGAGFVLITGVGPESLDEETGAQG